MAENTITLEERGDVALITIDDGKANAINVGVIDALLGALDQAEEAKALVVAGRPGRFSGGFDLKEIEAGNVFDLFSRGAEVATRLFEYPRPAVLACTGHAVAMGAVLLMTADWRVGAEGSFKVGLPEIRIALPLPKFAACLADYRLDPRRLAEATLLAEVFDPAEAVEVGFLDQLVPLDDVVETAVARAAVWGDELDPKAFVVTRRNLRGRVSERLADALANP